MVDQIHQSLASSGSSNVRSHSPYCEATGPIVDEGFVAARIRDLQRVYHQKRLPIQSHSPMSPCPIYPKLQKYELFSRAEPYESLTGSPLTRTIGSSTPRSLRHNYVSARYLSNSNIFKAWNRSADDLDQTKFLWPRYRKPIRKGYSASSSNMNDSLEDQVFSIPPRASDRKEHEPQTERRLLQKSNQGPNDHHVQIPTSGVGGESSAASRSAINQKNKLKEGVELRYNAPVAIVQLAEPQRISETPQDNLADAAPFQAIENPLSTPEHLGQPGPPAANVANQCTGESITLTLPQKHQGTSRPKGGYGDLNRTPAPVTEVIRIGSDADKGLHAEAPIGISCDLSNTLNRAGQGNIRRQSLPARLGGPNRHPSSTSTKSPSIASSSRSSSLWKKWRSWKLVLVDKSPSIQDLSDGPHDPSLSSVNEIMNQPPEVEQANLDHKLQSPYMQPMQKTRMTRNLPEISRAEEFEESKARFSVEIVPQTQVHQPPRSTQEVSGASRGAIPPNTTVNGPVATPQPHAWVATLPLDETLPDSKMTSLSAEGDDVDEVTDSADSSKGQKIKKIQIVVSFDEVADLVIEAHLKGKK